MASNGAPVDATGAVGSNRGEYHTIGEQRGVSPHMVSAMLTQSVAAAALAVTAMEYSFAHQLADGSFQVVQFTGSPFTLPTYDPVSVDFFMADLGHSLMVCEESGWFQTSTTTASLRQRIEALRPRILLTLHWLSQPAQVTWIQRNAVRGANRLAVASAAFVLAGRWANDALAMHVGATLTQAVIAAETSDGVLLEEGGYDSMYQAVSLHNLGLVYLHLGTPLSWLRAPLALAIGRGVAREDRSILASGQIVTAGNTRVYCGGGTFHGTQKGGDYRDVVLTLLYGSVVRDAALNAQAAQNVATYYAGNHAPPAAC